MTRIFDRTASSGEQVASDSAGQVAAVFNAAGIASVSSADDFLPEFSGIEVPGEPGVDEAEGTAGNANVTVTVPSGKYWRLIGAFHSLITDATVTNRAVVFTTRTSADATIEAITHANVAASTTAKRVTLWGTDDNVRGDRAVAAQGTLTIAEPVTADDDITINGTVFTIVSALSGAENEILLGANEAATKTALDAAFGASRTGTSGLHSVTDATYTALGVTAADFSGDDMVFTANVKGTAGNSIATTENLTHASNVWDAATLGTTTAGVDAADKVSTLDFPTAGPYLTPGEDILVSVTNGQAGDAYDTYIFYVEYDTDIS